MNQTSLRVAVIGAGPAGLALALHAASAWPLASITVLDARSAQHDVSGDPRTLALAAGSVQLLRRLQAWPAEGVEPILEVHVSQGPGSASRWARAAEVHLRAAELPAAALGAVLSYGTLVSALQRRWEAAVSAAPLRLASRFGAAVRALHPSPSGVEVEAAERESFDLAVVAEGGVFADQARKGLSHDYGQTAWVGTVTLEGATRGLAVERFTRDGPLALLPLPGASDDSTTRRAALVWCVASASDPVRELDEPQRRAVLASLLPAAAGRVVALGALKAFALGLSAERTLVQGRTVRIGNAAQTLHPVAGQGLNLGLRDAVALVAALRFSADIDGALRRVEWSRAVDRWSMIAATDFLARSFTWQWPGAHAARGLALGALEHAGPLKRALARQMMFGWR